MKHLKLDRRCDNFSSFTKMSVASHDAARNRFLLCIMQRKTRENREHKKEQQKTSMSDKQRKYPRGLSSSALYFAFSSCSFCLPSAAACLPASIARTEIFSAALGKKGKIANVESLFCRRFAKCCAENILCVTPESSCDNIGRKSCFCPIPPTTASNNNKGQH